MKKPIIGIATRYYLDNGKQKYHIAKEYIDKLTRLGAIPILIFPDTLQEIITFVDGIVLPGGDDSDPCYYQEIKHEKTEIAPAWMDTLDFQLVHLCQEKQIPLFGICRGLQSINIALGGSLYQDVPSQYPNALSHNQATHTITTVTGSNIQNIAGKEYVVNSYHHQAIKKLGNGLTITATSNDGIVECIEGINIFAVQFHPELLDDITSDNLFAYWIETCRSHS